LVVIEGSPLFFENAKEDGIAPFSFDITGSSFYSFSNETTAFVEGLAGDVEVPARRGYAFQIESLESVFQKQVGRILPTAPALGRTW
jgi:hypothetical protein